MRNDPHLPEPTPERRGGVTPPLLAAFLDGELDAAERSRVEAWLADRPAAAAEIGGQRRVARLWGETPPPEPGPDAWAAVLANVEARLPIAGRRPRRRPWLPWVGAAAAAAVIAAVLLSPFFHGGAAPTIAERTDPLPVIQLGDVVIVSMDARDAGGLVVARPPVQQPILLARQDDVSFMSMESYPRDDGLVPQIGEGEVPMIVAPLARAGGREP